MSSLAHILSPSLKKQKKIHSEKNSYLFSKKAFFIFRKSTLKKVIFSYISGDGTF